MVELEHRDLGGRADRRGAQPGGLDVESLDLVQPSLDDVFVAKTGQHLEGAQETDETEAVQP